MKKRIPIVAFLMSFFIWGFGQIYNANLKLGFKLFFLFFANNVFAFTLIPFSWPSAIQKLYGIIFVIVWFGNAVHAFKEAKKIKKVKLTKLNKIWFYIGFAVLYLTLLLVIQFLIVIYYHN